MQKGIDVIKETTEILKRLEQGEIKPEFAKSEILYMINAAKTMQELRTTYAAYEEVELQK